MKNRLCMKGLSVVLALFVLFAMTACGGTQNSPGGSPSSAPASAPSEPSSQAPSEPASAPTSQAATEPENSSFVLEYPADMKELGFTEPLVLEKRPERVAALTVAPVPALYELGVRMVGIPISRTIVWPEDLTKDTALVNFNAHSPEDFDFESLVVLEPDLVILSSGAADTAGKKLIEEFNIPVYYVKGGHTVQYESVKMQTEQLVKSFGVGDAEEAGKAVMKRFADLEARVSKAREAFAGKTVMVLQSGSEKHYIQTKGGTLGSMLKMIGFANVFENEGSSMLQLDMEQALSYNPDYVVCVGGTTAEDHKVFMEKVFSEHPEYWNTIEAIKRGDTLYLGIEYVANTGTHVVEHIDKLVDRMYKLTGIEPK